MAKKDRNKFSNNGLLLHLICEYIVERYLSSSITNRIYFYSLGWLIPSQLVKVFHSFFFVNGFLMLSDTRNQQ